MRLNLLTYAAKHNCSAFPPNRLYSVHTATGKTFAWFVWFLAVFLLISAGTAYRVLAPLVVDAPITLPIRLSAFPVEISDWVGKELPIPAITKEYMEKNFADDFTNRRYINTTTKAWADVYIVYCASRPGSMLGHRPQVCYPGHGWIHESTKPYQFTSQAGREILCLKHRFLKPAPLYDEIVVLNFYILNGQITANEKDFSGLLGRWPNLAGDPARYVAQVQISSVLEISARTAAIDMTDLILTFLPDENGDVEAVEYIKAESKVRQTVKIE